MNQGKAKSKSIDGALIAVTVRITKKTHRELNEIAAADRRSVANLLRKLVEDYVRDHKAAAGPETPEAGKVADKIFGTDGES